MCLTKRTNVKSGPVVSTVGRPLCDASAIEHAATLNRDGARELWCGSRLVERWEQDPGVGHSLTHAFPVLTSDNI
jgi:hypothetical protein